MLLGNETWLTGGPDGIAVPRLIVFGWRVSGSYTWYYISGAMVLIGAWLALNLVHSSTGRALRAIHDSEIAARLTGIDVAKSKLAVFVVSAVYASLAGSGLALFDGQITPSLAGFVTSVELVTMIVIGGLGSVLGAVIGAAILVILPQAVAAFADWNHVILGALIMVFMIFLREGIVPSLLARLPGARS